MLRRNGKLKEREAAVQRPSENAMRPRAEPKQIVKKLGYGWYEVNGQKVRKKDLTAEQLRQVD